MPDGFAPAPLAQPSILSSLPVARYRLDFRVETPLTLPPFAGSTLRGAFGAALRSAACVTRSPTCDGCPLLFSCPYALIFEPRPASPDHPLQEFSQIPRPYVIEPPQWGEKHYAPGDALRFHLVLAGRATQHLALITLAFHRAFQRGVGRNDGRATLTALWHERTEHSVQLLADLSQPIPPHEPQVPPLQRERATHVRLTFTTPLRLQTNGRRASTAELTARKLLLAVVRRIALIHEFHGPGALPLDFRLLAQKAEAIESRQALTWRDWRRYSTRQQRAIDLGGLLGEWHLFGDLTPFLPFLHLGQWLHVGKEAVFGLGGYRLEVLA